MAYIEFRNVVKSFDDATVLKNINMTVEKGQLVTLLGPSGCGKSTLLRCLAGLETVTSGQIILDGKDITNLPASKRDIGMVFQQYSLFPNMTVAQNIAFGLKMKKVSRDVIEKKVQDAVRMVELEGKENSYPANLSGGQQQRVALARSIVMEPKVLLLDEPLSAIDAKLRKALQQRIREIHEELGLTIVFVTHDQDEAMIMSDVIQLFHEGQIEQSGTPVSVYTAPQSRFVASFMGNYNILAADEFKRLVGEDTKTDIAIRPETIQIMQSPVQDANTYLVEGVIKNNTPRGNVLRYKIDCGGTKLNADVLFRSFTLFENGSKVYLSIPKHDCLSVAK